MLAELREMVEGDGDGSEFPHYHEIMAQIKECPCQHTSPVFLCQHVVSTWIQAIRCYHIYLMNLSTSYHFSNLFNVQEFVQDPLEDSGSSKPREGPKSFRAVCRR